jgi:very-short-patch-repair endonuclease
MPACNQRCLCDKDNCETCFERSFASHPKAMYWSNENEKKPREVFKQTHGKYIFDCNVCQHNFEMMLSNICKGRSCPYCSTPPKQLCTKEDCKHCFEKSFASHPKVAYWSKQNTKQPRDVFKQSNNKYKFKCNDCNHTFETQLSNIVSANQWCPYCCSPPKQLCTKDNCMLCFEKSFSSHPKAMHWSEANTKTPREVFKGTPDKYKFNCDTCNHSFESALSHISNSKWCPYCCVPSKKLCDEANCQHCFDKSFASHPKAIHWSEENTETTREVFKATPDKYKFNCDTCNHSFESALSHISNSKWCPYCCVPSKKLCDEANCQHCFDKSFASHPKAIHWSKKNNKNPRDVFKGTNSISFKFDCKLCYTTFETRLNNVTSHGTWCPNCKHKTERKLYEYLLSQNISTLRQAKFDWCKNTETGKHFRFDFVIESKRIIIEVDGLQHFEQVSNWQCPEKTQSRDMLKMNLAQENEYTIIRIFQEDVLYDTYDWKTHLINALIQYDTPTCLYMSKDKNRYSQYQSNSHSS